MVKPHLSPRAAAVQLLNGVLLEGKLIAELLAENILAPLAPEARARAQRLALETLRGQVQRSGGVWRQRVAGDDGRGQQRAVI